MCVGGGESVRWQQKKNRVVGRITRNNRQKFERQVGIERQRIVKH